MPASVLDQVRSAERLITRRGGQRNRAGTGRSWVPRKARMPGKAAGLSKVPGRWASRRDLTPP